jgi:AcrR family transcriptional regulator
MQARAEATRRKIIDSAVDLFSELGYGETGLADVLQRAGVSKGAFYYHFESKEAVAAAIIEEFDRRCGEMVAAEFDAGNPRLEGLVAATFGVQNMMWSDKVGQTGQLLSQALGQVSGAGSRVYAGWTTRFAEMVKSLIDAGELRPELNVEDVAEAMWAGVLGCHLVSAAVGDDPFTRLGRSWRVVLRSLVPEDSGNDVTVLVDRVAQRYSVAV